MNNEISLYKHWRAYQAIRMHFEYSKYDCFRFGFKAKSLTIQHYRSNWERRPIMHLFKTPQMLCKNEWSMVEYYFSNIVFGEKYNISDMNRKYWQSYTKRMESFGYLFRSDIKYLSSLMSINELLRPSEGESPPIVRIYFDGGIHYETLVIMEMLMGFGDKAMKKMHQKHSFWWPSFSERMQKSAPFLERRCSKEKARKIILETFTNQQ